MERAFIPLDIDIAGQSAEVKRQTAGKQEEDTRGREYRPENNQRYGKLFHL